MKNPTIATNPDVQALIERALREDVGPGDATTLALVGEGETAHAQIVARESCVVAGGPLIREVFAKVDPKVRAMVCMADGERAEAGAVVATLDGPAQGILTGERLALNLLQRLSGIATLTRQYVDLAAPYGVEILDTRKTTPTLRILEKYAVVCGGGANHRFGLFDRVLIKDNHIASWRARHGGSLADVVRAARARHPDLTIEIEVDTIEQLKEALEGRPDWALLDNMTPERLRECVALCRDICKTEASGGVTLDTVAAIAATGVDAISVGALTHSARACDLAIDFLHMPLQETRLD